MVNNHGPCVTDPIINSCVFMNTHPTLDGQPTISPMFMFFSQECSNANHHSYFWYINYYAFKGRGQIAHYPATHVMLPE